MQLAEARQAVLTVRERLDSLIVSYQKKLANRNLQFLEVSGITHLIEVLSRELIVSEMMLVQLF